MATIRSQILLSVVCVASATVGAEPLPADLTADKSLESIRFDDQIRPILVRNCSRCHGPDEPQAGLNLTDPAAALAPLDSGVTAIVPHDLAASELWRRVTADADDERMPPEGDRLADHELELLRRWIDEGATWPRHWAYSPLIRPRLPQLESDELRAWCQTPVDAFVAAGLERRGLQPSAAADSGTFLRRLYFDLLGVPPTLAERTRWEKLGITTPPIECVEVLLADPRYGERWARHWLDLVHFAETHGHDQDRPRPHAWPYRDYVIGALNDDRPYARFVQEQIAGDVLFPETPAGVIATGFLAAGPWDESSLRDIREDSLDREVARYLDRDDIVTSIMSTFVSTSVHCARCHHHKFDPVSQDDYYSLQAVFAGTDKANRTVDLDPTIAQRRRGLQDHAKQLSQWLVERNPLLLGEPYTSTALAWESAQQAALALWPVWRDATATATAGSSLTAESDGSWFAAGARPDKESYVVVGRPPLDRIAAIRLDVLTDDRLPQRGPGRQDNGNLHLSEIQVFVVRAGAAVVWEPVPLAATTADYEQSGWTAAHATDGNPNTAWGVHPAVGEVHQLMSRFAQPVALQPGDSLRIELHQLHGHGHLLGKFRLLVTADEQASQIPLTRLSSTIRDILAVPAAARTPEQRMELAAHAGQDQVRRQLAELPPEQQVYCGTSEFQPDGSFRSASVPRTVQVLDRGQVTNPLREAYPAALTLVEGLDAQLAVDDLTQEGKRRAALAGWLSDDRNSLVWRSIANRVWQYHFGRGLVDTPNDFGLMGESPSHPELLDWLACELRDNGGSLKSLHRLIVSSSVYQQSSATRPECAAVDADNRLLWRMSRRRLDAESYRDALLTIAGTLNRQMGGPSVKQFIESRGVHVTSNVDYQNFDMSDPANYRRSIYRFVYRTVPDPFLEALDCPDASQLTPKRTESITPQQALATLNDKSVVRQSQHLAESIALATTEVDEQVRQAFRAILGRDPDGQQLALVAEYVQRHGLANACRYLFNTNEFMFLD